MFNFLKEFINRLFIAIIIRLVKYIFLKKKKKTTDILQQ